MKEFFRKGYVDALNAAVYAVIYACDVHSNGFPGDLPYLLVALIGVRCFQLASDLNALENGGKK